MGYSGAMRTRETIELDNRGRSYLGKLGYERGTTIVADRLEGEEDAWVIRPGRVITEIEHAILSNPKNVASLRRAIAQAEAGEPGTDLA